jgi:hypothetical protein
MLDSLIDSDESLLSGVVAGLFKEGGGYAYRFWQWHRFRQMPALMITGETVEPLKVHRIEDRR